MLKSKRKGMVGRISASRSRNMAAIRAKNTKAEILLRKELFGRGFRFRLHYRTLPGKPDIVFPSQKVAIFCDGDFWHGRGWSKKMAENRFKVRKGYWVPKIEGNIARDRRNSRELRRLGWVVLRFWESDLQKNKNIAVKKIEAALEKRKRELFF